MAVSFGGVRAPRPTHGFDVGCRAASPLAAARGVLPCGANLFLKGAIGGKKCEYPHKLEFDTLYLSRILLKPFCKA